MSIYTIGDNRPYSYYPGDLVEVDVPKHIKKPKPKRKVNSGYGQHWIDIDFDKNAWARKYQNKLGIVVESYWHDDWNFNHHLQVYIQETQEYVFIDTILVKKL